MEWNKTSEKEPRHFHNVLVLHKIHYQDFCTRAFLSGDNWKVMTWHGTDVVPKNEIELRTPLLERN